MEVPKNIKISNGEDFLWFAFIYYNVKSYIHGDKPICNYCKNELSVSRSKNIYSALSKVVYYSILYYQLEQLLINRNQYETYKMRISNIGVGMSKAAMERLKSNTDDYIELWEKHSSESMKKLLVNNISINKNKKILTLKYLMIEYTKLSLK
ncbi:hypothetical protein [Brachyspira catarrhinii]|uniref:Uncharacterized protein n=1 Tax=Brachyspira catarrhinii TaxID=2528966 RepID=A0ABY2TMW3_9SPIR|nr:hypothetical protein [Brachyspira catarrhinii]TKZ28980.1 hypothetical protein EZH24_11470 [Brachyspira catarrhinii]